MAVINIIRNSEGQLDVDARKVSIKRNVEVITWQIDPQALPGYTFTFAPIAFNNPGPFSEVVVAPKVLNVKDDNEKAGNQGLITYSLILKNAEGKLEVLDPEIENLENGY